ncbi:MAG: hypothetical protein IJH99_10195 [Eubacterium sp.]|nr:hypothetical protein [Eubacterium sp.]
MTETTIYVGLNDSVTREQIFGTEKYVSVMKKVCCAYHVPFSLRLEQGGYFHENGEYTQENTLVISIIDVPDDTIDEIAKDLCVFFHQESVMITQDRIKVYFINESIE